MRSAEQFAQENPPQFDDQLAANVLASEQQFEEDAVYPNVLIVGPSGSGKSTSLINLNPETTAILNVERKVLPFRKAKAFKRQVQVKSLKRFNETLDAALVNPEIKTIVIDSFTSLTEIVYEELVRHIEKAGDNVMTAWAQYGDTLRDVLFKSKQANKFVVFIAIEDSIQDDIGRITKTAAVQGRLKGKVAKEFEICLWSKIIDAENPSDQYKFVTNGDPSNEAKSPMEMFEHRQIENDLNAVLNTAYSYFNNLEA